MSGLKDMVEWRTISGQPVNAGEFVLTTECRSLVVNTPFFGFVWNRPVAVEVDGNGRHERLLIPNVTLMVQLGLVGLVLSLGIASLFRGRRA